MKHRDFEALCVIVLLSVIVAGPAGCKRKAPVERMDNIAESYVRLVLAVGQHDDGYVDAYYGPKEWETAAKAEKRPLGDVKSEGLRLIADLENLDPASFEEVKRLRHEFLIKQLQSLIARVEMLEGKRLSFDEESRALYDAVAPTFPESHFNEKLTRLETLLPGSDPLIKRYERYKKDFVIPETKLDQVFKAAIEEARRRTRQHIALPVDESFVVEYVTDKPWSGYNWYKGNNYSVIQINTDLPIYIDRAIDLAAHEGYPGHHVYNVLLEDRLVRGRGWIEYTVYPLFSPQSLIAEGSANFGIEVVFPGSERLEFERDVLFPLAGIDARKTGEYLEINKLVTELSYAGNEAARRYLNGEADADQTARWLTRYALMPFDRARQRVRFFDTYRSYVINYNLGQDLVKRYIEALGGTADNPEVRWAEFERLISSPRLPSGLN